MENSVSTSADTPAPRPSKLFTHQMTSQETNGSGGSSVNGGSGRRPFEKLFEATYSPTTPPTPKIPLDDRPAMTPREETSDPPILEQKSESNPCVMSPVTAPAFPPQRQPRTRLSFADRMKSKLSPEDPSQKQMTEHDPPSHFDSIDLQVNEPPHDLQQMSTTDDSMTSESSMNENSPTPTTKYERRSLLQKLESLKETEEKPTIQKFPPPTAIVKPFVKPEASLSVPDPMPAEDLSLLKEILQQLTLEECAKESWENSSLQMMAGSSEISKSLWKFLVDNFVRKFENQFDQNICFSSVDFENICTNFKTSYQKSLNPILSPLEPFLSQKIDSFLKEYKERNREIKKCERQFVKILVNESMKSYKEKMLSSLPQNEEEERLLDAEINSKIQTIFQDAGNFKNLSLLPDYRLEFEQEFADMEIEVRRDMKQRRKIFQYESARHFEKLKANYHANFLDNITLDDFEQAESTAQKQTLDLLEETKILQKLPQAVYSSLRESLIVHMNQFHNQKRSELIKNPKNIDTNSNSPTTPLPDPPKVTENISYLTRTPQPYSMGSPNPDLSSPHSQFSPKIHKIQNSHHSPSKPMPDRRKLDQVLPEGKIAIHLGLHRTKCGVILSDGNLEVVIDVPNAISFKNENQALIPELDEGGYDFCSPTNFEGLLLQNRIDQVIKVDFGSSSDESLMVRIEELMAIMLVCIKRQAEMKLRQFFPDCLILVPQSLNQSQREAVSNAAFMAGFRNTDLMCDTMGIALAAVRVQGTLIEQRKFSVLNLFEDFVDGASFEIQKGILRRTTISGDYFIDKNRTFLLVFTAANDEKKNLEIVLGDLGCGGKSANIKCVVACPPHVVYEKVHLKIFDYPPFKKVSGEYALLGAATLLSIERGDEDSLSWWRRHFFGPTFQQWKTELLDNTATGHKKFSNASGGYPLSVHFLKKPNRFVENGKILHEAKMELLQGTETVLGKLGISRQDDGERKRMRELENWILSPHVTLNEVMEATERVWEIHNQL